MSWRTVVITGISKLDYKLGYMVVRKKDSMDRIFIEEISILLIDSTRASLTTALISELIKNKVKIIFCDEKHNPHSELLPYYGSHNTSLKVREQAGWEEDIKNRVWEEIVSNKILHQKIFLEEIEEFERANILSRYISNIAPKDENNREGLAAKVYFAGLFGLEFTRTKPNHLNSALNYGYEILLSTFNKEIVQNGYITQLGLFHRNIYNQFNLASDLMEPFRIMVDRTVRGIDLDIFGRKEKLLILDVLNEEVIIDGQRHFLSNAIRIYCKSIFDAINYKDITRIKFYKNEL